MKRSKPVGWLTLTLKTSYLREVTFSLETARKESPKKLQRCVTNISWWNVQLIYSEFMITCYSQECCVATKSYRRCEPPTIARHSAITLCECSKRYELISKAWLMIIFHFWTRRKRQLAQKMTLLQRTCLRVEKSQNMSCRCSASQPIWQLTILSFNTAKSRTPALHNSQLIFKSTRKICSIPSNRLGSRTRSRLSICQARMTAFLSTCSPSKVRIGVLRYRSKTGSNQSTSRAQGVWIAIKLVIWAVWWAYTQRTAISRSVKPLKLLIKRRNALNCISRRGRRRSRLQPIKRHSCCSMKRKTRLMNASTKHT